MWCVVIVDWLEETHELVKSYPWGLKVYTSDMSISSLTTSDIKALDEKDQAIKAPSSAETHGSHTRSIRIIQNRDPATGRR